MSPLKITHKIGDHLRYKFNIFPTLCECSVQHEISKQLDISSMMLMSVIGRKDLESHFGWPQPSTCSA